MSKQQSRGLRNCNPGNIRRSNFRYVGERPSSTDSEFRQFVSMEYGYRALFRLLRTYDYIHHRRTIRTIIERYAPPSENNTAAYIRRVVERTGFDADRELNTLCHDDMVALAAAISEVENGTMPNMEEVEAGWKLFIEQFKPGASVPR